MCETLPGVHHRPTVEESIAALVGTYVDEAIIAETAWRLAGNHRRLRQRKAVPKWHVQKFHEWVPAQVISCRRTRHPRAGMGATVTFRILAGTPAGLGVSKWWSFARCRMHARDFGFSRPPSPKAVHPPKFVYSAPEQLVSMRCYLLVTPKASGNEPGFEYAGFPASVKPWNSELIKCRLRTLPQYRCPQGHPQSFPCHKCPIGYINCKPGTHKSDWVEGQCAACGQADAFFDPDVKSETCISCTIKAAYKRES